MKKTFFIIITLLISFCLFAEDSEVGLVTQISGKVTVSREDDSFQVLVGDIIKSNDTLQTLENSFIEIKLSDGKGHCIIKENSKILMTSYKTETDLNFSFALSFGGVQSTLEKDKEDYYNITTPTITSGVRGTKFSIFSNILGETFVEVEEGVVEVGEVDINNIGNGDKAPIKNSLNVGKGEKVKNQLDNKNKIVRASKTLEEWQKEGIDNEKIKHIIPFYIIKIQMLSQGIYKIDSIQQKLDKIDTQISGIFDKIKQQLDAAKKKYGFLFSDSDYDKLMKQLLKKNAQTKIKFFIQKRKLLKHGFLLFNDYYTTIDIVKQMLIYIDANNIKINRKNRNALELELKNIKKTNKDINKLAKKWRKYAYIQKKIR